MRILGCPPDNSALEESLELNWLRSRVQNAVARTVPCGCAVSAPSGQLASLDSFTDCVAHPRQTSHHKNDQMRKWNGGEGWRGRSAQMSHSWLFPSRLT